MQILFQFGVSVIMTLVMWRLWLGLWYIQLEMVLSHWKTIQMFNALFRRFCLGSSWEQWECRILPPTLLSLALCENECQTFCFSQGVFLETSTTCRCAVCFDVWETTWQHITRRDTQSSKFLYFFPLVMLHFPRRTKWTELSWGLGKSVRISTACLVTCFKCWFCFCVIYSDYFISGF